MGSLFKNCTSIPYSLTFICFKLNMVSILTKVCGLSFQTQNVSGPKKKKKRVIEWINGLSTTSNEDLCVDAGVL